MSRRTAGAFCVGESNTERVEEKRAGDTLYLFKFELELMAKTARYAFNVCMNLKNVLLRMVLYLLNERVTIPDIFVSTF